MNFFTEINFDMHEGKFVVTKIYYCPCCHYKRHVNEIGDRTKEIEGDEPFILFPLSSLVQSNGEKLELCACPKCHSLQYIKHVLDESETDYIIN